MYCADQIIILATDLYKQVGSPSSLSVGFISGWITDSGNLGDINNKLNTSFFLSADCITDSNGGFAGEEASIMGLMYKSEFYETASLSVLANALAGGGFWTSINEGDTKISRTDMSKVSKAYLDLNAQSNQFLRLAIHDYKLRNTVPQCVIANQTYQSPTP